MIIYIYKYIYIDIYNYIHILDPPKSGPGDMILFRSSVHDHGPYPIDFPLGDDVPSGDGQKPWKQMGVSINGGTRTPIARWFIRENPIKMDDN